jgi:hypothetical protein
VINEDGEMRVKLHSDLSRMEFVHILDYATPVPPEDEEIVDGPHDEETGDVGTSIEAGGTVE